MDASALASRPDANLLEDWRAGRNEAATAGVKRLWPVIEGLFADSNPVPCKAMMASMGADRDTALAASLLWRAASFIPQVVLGIVTFLIWRKQAHSRGRRSRDDSTTAAVA